MAGRSIPANGALHFDFDAQQIESLTLELGLTEKQAKFALSRALRRTAGTLRRMSERGLRSELGVKKLSYLRRRLKIAKFRGASFEGARLWYGANDMPVSALHGIIETDGKGASFTSKTGSENFAGGFVRKSRRGWGRTIFIRKGRKRLPIAEAEMPVKDRMDTFIEDEIFDQVNEIFWKHFERDMEARAKFGVGRRDYR